MLTVDVRSRVEPELKREAAAVLKAAGLDVSTAIRLFLRSGGRALTETWLYQWNPPPANERILY